jgi:uncharacterized protein (TIGR03086 family)
MTDQESHPHDETLDRFRRCTAGFTERLESVGDEQWHAPTPCSEWDVRALVNHVCGEQRWMAALLDGQSIAQVGDSLSGDLLGQHPVDAWREAVASVESQLRQPGVLEEVVHLSSGPASVARYCDEVAADTLVHTWDLAQAIGADENLPQDLVEAATVVAESWVSLQGVPGLFAAPVPDEGDVDQQTALLAMLGRSAQGQTD